MQNNERITPAGRVASAVSPGRAEDGRIGARVPA